MIGVVQKLLSAVGAFFRWWFGELAALVPAPLRRVFSGNGERLLLELDGAEARLYRQRGRRREQLPDNAVKKRARGKALGVTLALPRALLVTRDTELPLAAEENLREVLGFEMDRLTPFSRSEVYYDFKVAGRDAKRAKLRVSVLLSPCRAVDSLIAESERQGFSVAAVDVAAETEDETLGVNLLPSMASRPASRFARFAAGALTASAATLLSLAAEIPMQRQADYAEALSQQVAAERARVTALRKLEAEIAGLLQQDISLADLKSADALSLAKLDHITRLLPDGAWLTQLSLAGDRLELSGFSPASSKLLTTFEESPLFTETVFRAPVTQDPRLGLERFSLSLKVVAPEARP
ncbi:PilN domain-containing protein [Pelagibius sp.]|uniref:PilN domain-containing protein n=1 Tax=Pelagibius sp. TaxID=1931238 RepID=UPI002607ACE7|nr:PilN domain-containing protein [Pelagibius sp.]